MNFFYSTSPLLLLLNKKIFRLQKKNSMPKLIKMCHELLFSNFSLLRKHKWKYFGKFDGFREGIKRILWLFVKVSKYMDWVSDIRTITPQKHLKSNFLILIKIIDLRHLAFKSLKLPSKKSGSCEKFSNVGGKVFTAISTANLICLAAYTFFEYHFCEVSLKDYILMKL